MKILLVIDVQSYFVNEYTKEIPKRIVSFIDTHKFDHVLFFQYSNKPDSNFVKFHNWTKMYGPPETDIVPELQKYLTKDNIYPKYSFTVFKAKDFEDFVSKHKDSEIYICGIDTDACVMSSEFDAFERGYNARVIKDLSASHSGETYHQKAIDLLEKNLGRRSVILSSEI